MVYTMIFQSFKGKKVNPVGSDLKEKAHHESHYFSFAYLSVAGWFSTQGYYPMSSKPQLHNMRSACAQYKAFQVRGAAGVL